MAKTSSLLRIGLTYRPTDPSGNAYQVRATLVNALVTALINSRVALQIQKLCTHCLIDMTLIPNATSQFLWAELKNPCDDRKWYYLYLLPIGDNFKEFGAYLTTEGSFKKSPN